jgi:CRISPR/Cas system CMR-associated protein Cmr5 small subunit
VVIICHNYEEIIMAVNRLLATLEDYLAMKREVGKDCDISELKEASKRVELSLREYLQNYFDRALMEDRRRSSSQTTEVMIMSADRATYSWNDVCKILDALNNAPIPPVNLDDKESIDHWLAVYKEWFKAKKQIVINPSKLDLDFTDIK